MILGIRNHMARNLFPFLSHRNPHMKKFGFEQVNLMLYFHDNGSNPDQSKHLETARMRLFDVWIDLVNLRAEDYSGNSRIPTMVRALSVGRCLV